MSLLVGKCNRSQQVKSETAPVSYRGGNRNLSLVPKSAILWLFAGATNVWGIDYGSNTMLPYAVGALPAARFAPPDPFNTTAETAPQNMLLSGVAGMDSGGKRGKLKQPAKVSPIIIEQQPTGSVDPRLMNAYLAYRDGKLDEANKLYLILFREDANNPDVLLGLAAIAQQDGENLLAAQYFSQVLALDPRNAVANAGMSALGAGDDGNESRLKILLREQRNSAVLHFALGNIYAGQSRWNEAQQAYFNAYALEPDNAGFAFNLAVGLEHLGQNRLAVQHYRRALQLDPSPGKHFDHTQILQHVEALSRYGNAD